MPEVYGLEMRQSRRRTGASPIVKFVGVLIIASAIAGIVYGLWSYYHDYKPEIRKFTFTRKVGEGQLDPSKVVEKVFADPREYDAGKGFSLQLRYLDEAGREDPIQSIQYTFAPWRTREATSPADRIDAVNRERETNIQKVVADFNNPKPHIYRFDLYVDDTGGMNARLRKQILEVLADLKIEELLNRGNGTEIYFYRLTDQLTAKRPLVRVPRHADSETITAALEELSPAKLVGKNGVLHDSPDKRTSEIANGLLTWWGMKSQQRPEVIRRCLIFSDGVENSDRIDFGHNPGLSLLLKHKNAQIDAKILAGGTMPDLSGLRIDWYVPEQLEYPVTTVTAAMQYWQGFLERCGVTQFASPFLSQ